jgi:hypothetical protein
MFLNSASIFFVGPKIRQKRFTRCIKPGWYGGFKCALERLKWQ